MSSNLQALAEERRLREEQRRQEGAQQPNPHLMSSNNDEEVGLLSGLFAGSNRMQQLGEPKRARDESLCDVMHINLCPKMYCCSFTVGIVMVDIIVYAISLMIDPMVNTEFLAPNPTALSVLGWQDAAKIKQGQIWRFITPVFLHASFVHIVLNSLSTMVVGSGIEHGIGGCKLALIYFMSAFGGVLFSCVFNPETHSVGASTGIFGMIGYYIAYICTEWDRIGQGDPTRRFALLFFTIIILMFNIQIGLANPKIDNLGHLGGLIVGIILGFAISANEKREQQALGLYEYSRRSECKDVCAFIFLATYLVAMLLIFFFVIDVQNAAAVK